jgi:hypothetical protein
MLRCCRCALLKAGVLQPLRNSACCCCSTATTIAVIVLRSRSGAAVHPAAAVLVQGRRNSLRCVRAILRSLSKGRRIAGRAVCRRRCISVRRVRYPVTDQRLAVVSAGLRCWVHS